jgi:hypothetical protein
LAKKKARETNLTGLVLAETESAIALFQVASINAKNPLFMRLAEDYLFQSISTDTIQCHI